MVFALYRGYKSGFLNLFEFCVLLASLLVYEIQNLTVFDTIPASLTFYVLVGFCGFVWTASLESIETNNKPAKKKNSYNNSLLALGVFGVSAVVTIYLIYATGIVALETAKAVNYGYAYSSVDLAKSYDFYQRAMTLPFNFDKTQSAQKYAETALNAARASTPETEAQVLKFLDGAIAALNDALKDEPNYPILWMDLSQTYIFKGVDNGKLVNLDPRAEEAINRAIELSPVREEGYISLAQLRAVEGRWAEAEQIIKNLLVKFPKDSSLVVQLANFYRDENKTQEAVKILEDAQSKGFTFSSFSEMKWLVDYYMGAKNYDKASALLTEAVKIDPNNLDAYIDTVKLYALTGRKDEAINLAQNISKADPTRQKEMQDLIEAIKGKPAAK